MRTLTLQPVSLLAGAALTAAAFLAMAQMPAPERQTFEYQILVDVEDEELDDLAAEGWELAGYLGQSKKGSSSDETLWRRAE